MNRAQLDDAVGAIESFTITEFKEHTREVMDLVVEHKAVAILRHKAPQAVLIPAADYVQFVKLKRERLDLLTRRYDEMAARMRTAEAAAGVDALFDATPEELGRAAVLAAKHG